MTQDDEARWLGTEAEADAWLRRLPASVLGKLGYHREPPLSAALARDYVERPAEQITSDEWRGAAGLLAASNHGKDGAALDTVLLAVLLYRESIGDPRPLESRTRSHRPAARLHPPPK